MASKYLLYEKLWQAVVDKILSGIFGLIGYFVFGPFVATVVKPFGQYRCSYLEYNLTWLIAVILLAIFLCGGIFYFAKHSVSLAVLVFSAMGVVAIVGSAPVDETYIVFGLQNTTLFGAAMDLNFVLFCSGLLCGLFAAGIPVAYGAVKFVQVVSRRPCPGGQGAPQS